MACTPVYKFPLNSTGFYRNDRHVGIPVALVAICLSSFIFSTYSIILRLPIGVTYVSVGLAMISLVTFAVNCIKREEVSRKHPRLFLYEYEEKDDEERYKLFARLPDELFLNIFQNLNSRELVIASLVCRRWETLSSDEELWRKCCLKEIVCPNEDFCGSWRDLFIQSQTFTYKLTHKKYKKSEMHIPASEEYKEGVPNQVRAVLICENGHFFWRTDFHGSDTSEKWDPSLKEKRDGSLRNALIHPRFKKIKGNIYVIGWNAKEQSIEVTDPCSSAYKSFNQKHRHVNGFVPPFELTENFAFVGHDDGDIGVWNLQTDMVSGKSGPSEHYDDDESKWVFNDKAELDFYKEMRMIDPHKYSEYAFQQDKNFVQNHQQTLSKRIVLKGHTQPIIALHGTSAFLFSSSEDGTIKQWDITSYQCVQTIETNFEKGASYLQAFAFWLFGVSDHTVKQWDLSTRECLLQIDLSGTCKCIQIFGNLLFCVHENENVVTVEIHNLFTKQCIKTIQRELEGCLSYPWDSLVQIVNDRTYLVDLEKYYVWDFSDQNLFTKI